MISVMKRLFRRKKYMSIVIRFTENGKGQVKTEVKLGMDVPVSFALSAIDRIKWDIQTRLTNKAKLAGLDSNNPKTRAFIKAQTLKDLH